MTQDQRPEPNFKARMDARLAAWYKGRDPHPDPAVQKRRKFLASLVSKSVMTRYITKRSLPLPETLIEAESLEAVDFTDLPARVVIKPNNSADSKGVILFDGTRNLMNGDPVALADRGAYVRAIWERDGVLARPRTRIIVEEFLQDYDPAFVIPRDFKVFAVAGRAELIQVIDRNPEKALRTNSFFTRDWQHIDQPIKTNYRMGPAYDRPADLDRLLEMADRISADIQAFYRLDFYMTPRGPVFGEFTSYPSAGQAFTPYGDRLMCAMMDRRPDATLTAPTVTGPATTGSRQGMTPDAVIARFVELSRKAGITPPSGTPLSKANFRKKFHHVFFKLNRRSQRHHLFRDKLIFDAVIRGCGMETPDTFGLFRKDRKKRPIRCFARNDTLSLQDFLAQSPGRYFVKSRDGAGGAGSFLLSVQDGAALLDGSAVSEPDLQGRFAALPGDALIQTAVPQHHAMARLNATSINTLRVITALGRGVAGRAKLMAVAIRIGRAGAMVDNLAAGGLFCQVDAQTGRLQGPLRSKDGTTHPVHPDSGLKLDGSTIPHFAAALDQCRVMHELLGPAPATIGWDIAISPDGPVFMEGNMYWDPTLHIADEDFPLRLAAEVIGPGHDHLWKT